MAVCQVTIVPVGTGTASVSRYVAACVDALKKYDDLKVHVTPMSTIIEGEVDRVLLAVRDMHEIPFQAGVERVLTTVSIDDRRDQPVTMDGKVTAVLQKLTQS